MIAELLLLAPSEAQSLEARYLSARSSPEALLEFRKAESAALTVSSTQAASGLYEVTAGGVALVRFSGLVCKRMTFLGWLFGRTGSTERLAQAVTEAAADSAAKRILIIYDTPGGGLPGLVEASAALLAARAVKPLDSFIDDQALSAGYWLACYGQRVYLSRTSSAGCIGVRITAEDSSRLMKNMGVDAVYMTSVPGKGRGSADQPIERAHLAQLDSWMMSQHEQFISSVAEGRGISLDAARALSDGETYVGQAAVDRGLADEVTTLRDLIGRLDAEPVVIPDASIPLEPVDPDEGDDDCEARGAAAEGGPMATTVQAAASIQAAVPSGTTSSNCCPPGCCSPGGGCASDCSTCSAGKCGLGCSCMTKKSAQSTTSAEAISSQLAQLLEAQSAQGAQLAALQADRELSELTRGLPDVQARAIVATHKEHGIAAARETATAWPKAPKPAAGSVVEATATAAANAQAAPRHRFDAVGPDKWGKDPSLAGYGEKVRWIQAQEAAGAKFATALEAFTAAGRALSGKAA